MCFVVGTVLALSLIPVLLFIFEQIKINRQLPSFTLPPGLPLIGHLHWFIFELSILEVLQKIVKRYGGLVKLNFLYGFPFAVVTDLHFISYILGTKDILNKNDDYALLDRWLGKGLLTCSRAKWEKTRKVLTPAFHIQILEKYVDIFNSASDVLVEKLKSEIEKESFDVQPYITSCSLDIICESAMGTKINAQENKYSDYVQSVKEMCRILIYRSQNPLKYFDYFYVFTRDFWKEKRAVKFLHNFTNSIIQKRKREIADEDAMKFEDDVAGKQKLSFLDLLLNSSIDGKPLTDDEIRQEVDTFMFAGHDTTAAGIGFTLYCLSTHLDVQEKVFNELCSIYEDDKNRTVTYNDLQNMTYLSMVIKESLRLYPPVPIYARKPEKDVVYGENILSSKLQFTIFAYGIHRNPDNFPDPDKFDPERFNPENEIKPCSYIPFSMGPRNCIGQKFALLEMKAVLSKLLRNFEVLPVEGYEPQLMSLVVLKSTNGILIRIKKRETV